MNVDSVAHCHSYAITISPSIYIYSCLCFPSSWIVFNFTQKRENFSDLNLILDHLFIHLFILGILPLVTHKTWIYGNYDVRRESLAA